MNTQNSHRRGLITLLLWIIATAAGWIFGVIDLAGAQARTYMEILRMIPYYASQGLLIGLGTGLGQSLVLQPRLRRSSEWFQATFVGYGLAFPIGLLIATLIPSVAFPLRGSNFLPLSVPSTIFFTPYPAAVIFGGFVVGIAQWTVLRRILPKKNLRIGLLWMLGVWLGVGLGMFVGQWVYTVSNSAHLSGLFQTGLEQMAIGAITGIITGLILLTLLGKSGVQQT
jgi:hypothetical protein